MRCVRYLHHAMRTVSRLPALVLLWTLALAYLFCISLILLVKGISYDEHREKARIDKENRFCRENRYRSPSKRVRQSPR